MPYESLTHQDATTITLVMDNLEHPPALSTRLARRTRPGPCGTASSSSTPPKHGSWLNVVELNVMIWQCLNRRIDCIEALRWEVAAWQASRDRIQAKVDWQFTTDDARVKLKPLYTTFYE